MFSKFGTFYLSLISESAFRNCWSNENRIPHENYLNYRKAVQNSILKTKNDVALFNVHKIWLNKFDDLEHLWRVSLVFHSRFGHLLVFNSVEDTKNNDFFYLSRSKNRLIFNGQHSIRRSSIKWRSNKIET